MLMGLRYHLLVALHHYMLKALYHHLPVALHQYVPIVIQRFRQWCCLTFKTPFYSGWKVRCRKRVSLARFARGCWCFTP